MQGIAGALYPDETSASGIDRNLLTAEIVNFLLEETAHLKLSSVYVEHNMIPGREITIMDGSRSRHARALDICPDGCLRVEEEDGTISVLSYGEVSVLMKD